MEVVSSEIGKRAEREYFSNATTPTPHSYVAVKTLFENSSKYKAPIVLQGKTEILDF